MRAGKDVKREELDEPRVWAFKWSLAIIVSHCHTRPVFALTQHTHTHTHTHSDTQPSQPQTKTNTTTATTLQRFAPQYYDLRRPKREPGPLPNLKTHIYVYISICFREAIKYKKSTPSSKSSRIQSQGGV